jgi:TfoX/Sxy family transcriptional regulator of competence genes
MDPMILGRSGVSEKSMFGGLGYLVYGNMCCGIWKSSLIVRVGVEAATSLLKKPHAKVMDITGKPMKGWLLIQPKGFADDHALLAWINHAYDFASTLPKKS